MIYWNEPYSVGWELSSDPIESQLVPGIYYAEPIPPEPVGMTEEGYKDECVDLKVEITDRGNLFSIADDRSYGADDLHRILRMMDYKKREWEAKQGGGVENG